MNVVVLAQCPENLSFESGNFKNWVCSIGNVDQSGVVHMTADKIVADRHTLISADQNITDPFGHFSLRSPNGSKYVAKLGNDKIGAEAERFSYTFTVPADKHDYAIIYNYAVVFQNPAHFAFQQPRFNVNVFDVGANQYVPCSNADFIASSALPGFQLSDVIVSRNQDVYYKPWAQASIKIAGYAGKTLRLEFTTNDCLGGDHFGYAYIDINEECNTIVTGNIFCNGINAVQLKAPFGFEKYYWYDSNLNNLIDSSSVLKIDTPANGSVYGLIIKPYAGTGCTDTLFTTIIYDTVPFNFTAVDSANFCLPFVGSLTAQWITAGSSSGLNFIYYTDSSQTQLLQKPDSITKNGTYYIQASDNKGCVGVKPVNISINPSPKLSVVSPVTVSYPTTADLNSSSVILTNTNSLLFSFWKNVTASIPLLNPNMVSDPGIYFIKATNQFNCFDIQPVEVVVNIRPPNTFSPNGDGVHDRWEVAGLNKYSKCDINIFNRWGQLIYHSVGYNSSWDGTINGKSLPAATYYYVIKLSPSIKPISGFIDIIR